MRGSSGLARASHAGLARQSAEHAVERLRQARDAVRRRPVAEDQGFFEKDGAGEAHPSFDTAANVLRMAYAVSGAANSFMAPAGSVNPRPPSFEACTVHGIKNVRDALLHFGRRDGFACLATCGSWVDCRFVTHRKTPAASRHLTRSLRSGNPEFPAANVRWEDSGATSGFCFPSESPGVRFGSCPGRDPGAHCARPARRNQDERWVPLRASRENRKVETKG